MNIKNVRQLIQELSECNPEATVVGWASVEVTVNDTFESHDVKFNQLTVIQQHPTVVRIEMDAN